MLGRPLLDEERRTHGPERPLLRGRQDQDVERLLGAESRHEHGSASTDGRLRRRAVRYPNAERHCGIHKPTIPHTSHIHQHNTRLLLKEWYPLLLQLTIYHTK